MKLPAYAAGGLAALGLGLAACTTVTQGSVSPTSAPAHSAPARSNGEPPTVPPSASPSSSAQTSTPQSQSSPNVTEPWAVVSAYYGDIESGNFQQAWALLNSGATTGQTYQSFVNGFACTGSQQVSEVSATGDQVTFDLTATDTCNGQTQHFTGTDTVQDGKIVAANIQQD